MLRLFSTTPRDNASLRFVSVIVEQQWIMAFCHSVTNKNEGIAGGSDESRTAKERRKAEKKEQHDRAFVASSIMANAHIFPLSLHTSRRGTRRKS